MLENSRLTSRGDLPAAERPQHCRLVGLSALAEGPMDSRSCVRPFVRSSGRSFVRSRRDIWRSAHQIFLKLGTKLHLGETKKMFQADF